MIFRYIFHKPWWNWSYLQQLSAIVRCTGYRFQKRLWKSRGKTLKPLRNHHVPYVSVAITGESTPFSNTAIVWKDPISNQFGTHANARNAARTGLWENVYFTTCFSSLVSRDSVLIEKKNVWNVVKPILKDPQFTFIGYSPFFEIDSQ